MARGGNHTGVKWNKGGKLKRNQFGIDWSAFEELAEELDGLGADLQEIFGNAMEDSAKTIQDDTFEAMDPKNLPAKGKYSKGKTKQAIDRDPRTSWSGPLGEVGFGFDKTKVNSGNFLITGTPRMQPNYKLEDIYVRKTYKKGIVKDIMEYFMDELEDRMGG